MTDIISGVASLADFFYSFPILVLTRVRLGRYLTASSTRESRLSLLLNGLVKIPMQFGILLLGVLVFSYYQFAKEPLFFNQTQLGSAGQNQICRFTENCNEGI